MLKAFSIISANIHSRRTAQVNRSALLRHGASSAVTYGNRFANGYLERDWTGVGISTRFDVIIIHEAGMSGLATASLPPTCRTCGFTKAGRRTRCLTSNTCTGDDGLKYTNAYKLKVRTSSPSSLSAASTPHRAGSILQGRSLPQYSAEHRQRRQTAGGRLLRDFYQHFKYQNIMTEDVVQYFNRETGKNLTVNLQPVFAPRCAPRAGIEIRRSQWCC